MKKFLAILLCAALLLTTGLPAFAAESDAPPDKVIKLAKDTFHISSDFNVFRYNTQTDSQLGKKIYYLSWEQKKDNSPTIEIAVDENGYFYRYYFYEPNDETPSTLPTLSKQDALNSALAFAKEILPEAADEITPNRARVEYSYNTYEIRFDRDINGIRVANSFLELSVDKNNGTLVSYRAFNWPTGVEIDSAPAIIDAETARKSFQENLPLTLQYVSLYDEETRKNTTLLVYAPPRDYESLFLDAHTGKVLRIDRFSAPSPYNEAAADSAASGASKGDSGLSEEELAEIAKHNQFLKTEELLAKLAKMPELHYSSVIKLSSSSVTSVVSRYSDTVFYRTSLSFFSNDSKGQYASFDAETGELISFYSYSGESENKTAKVSEAAAKEIADQFLKANKNDKFVQSKLEEQDSYLNGSSYQYHYIRQVNGLPFYDNSITVTVDAVSGKITYLGEVWNNDASFESIEGVLVQKEASDAYFDFYGDSYFYLPVVKGEDGTLSYVSGYSDYTGSDLSLIPVYAYEISSYIDAKSGDVLNHSGQAAKPYTRYTVLENIYPQLAGHYVKDIANKLYDAGITLSNSDFDPDANITTKEFKELISYLDYKARIAFNASKAGVSDSSATLTRMDAVKHIIDAMGYEKIAKNTEIFQCPFTDRDAIGATNIGYASLAKGLGIVAGSNNCFMPAKTVTNAEALVMVYNCLNQS